MARFDVRQQETRPGIRKASGEDMGAIEGQANQQLAGGMADLGNTILAIEQRKRTREEVIERVRSMNSYSQAAEQELTRIQSEEDLSSTEVLKSYNNFLKESLSSAVENHGGSPESKAELTKQLEAQHGTYAQGAYKASVSAQYKVIGSHLEGAVNGIADQTSQLPGSFMENLNRLNVEIDKMAPALTPDQENGYRILGKQRITASAVQSYLNDGNTEAARAILATEGLAEDVGAENMLRFRQNILTRERATEKGEIAGQDALKKAATILGVTVDKLTTEQRTRIAGLSEPAGSKTLQQKVAEAEFVKGSPLTDAEISKIGGFHVADEKGMHGNSIDGRSLDIMSNMSSGFASGLLNPEDERAFVNAVTDYTQPKQVFDPDTGQSVMRQNRLPPYVREAFNRAGKPLPGADKTAPGGGTPGATGTDKFSFENDPVGADIPTVWARRKNIVGVGASMESFAEGIPLGIGDTLSRSKGGADVQGDRQYVELRQKTLTTALQNSPRFAETERQALDEAFNISGKAMDSDAAYASRVFAMDDYIDEELRRATHDLTAPNTTVQIRQAAMKDLANLSHFRMVLGVPPKLKPAEAKNLPVGTEFRTTDGRLLIVNAPQQGTGNE